MSDVIINVTVKGANAEELEAFLARGGGSLLPGDRDLTQVIELAASTVVLASALLDLWKAAQGLRKSSDARATGKPAEVHLETPERVVNLVTATERDIAELTRQILAARGSA